MRYLIGLIGLVCVGCATMQHDVRDPGTKAVEASDEACSVASAVPLVGVAVCGAALIHHGVHWLVTPKEQEHE